MPSRRCVVQGCSNVSDISAGISVHKSPIDKTLSTKWKAFLGTHRAHFKPDGRFAVCSDHFTPDSFERSVHVDGAVRRLKGFLSNHLEKTWENSDRGTSVKVDAW